MLLFCFFFTIALKELLLFLLCNDSIQNNRVYLFLGLDPAHLI